jgi:hypothetical protein
MTYFDNAICNSTTKPVFVVLFFKNLLYFIRPRQNSEASDA